jgi:PPOX class probable F420-dependent enzyme
MDLTAEQLSFLHQEHGACMVTLRPDGMPNAVRVATALVDGKLWSSGTADRARTKRLRRDPRATLMVFEGGTFRYLTLECTVTILDGPDALELNLRLFRVMQSVSGDDAPLSWFGGTYTPAEFVEVMRAERRLIYEFDVLRAYGLL